MEDTKTSKKKTKGAKRSDKRAARTRYWTAQRLMVRKLRALVRSGYTVEGALAVWAARGRVRRNSGDFLPTPAAKRLERIVAAVKVRRAKRQVRAMERWEAREKGRQA